MADDTKTPAPQAAPAATGKISGKSNTVASLIILVISGVGFLGGYLQSDYETEVENYTSLATSYGEQEQLISDDFQETIAEEQDAHQEIDSIINQIFDKVYLWTAINESTTMTPSDKATQQLLVQNSLCATLHTLERAMGATHARRIYDHFEMQNRTDPYLLAEPDPNAEYYYNISRADWNRFKQAGLSTGHLNTSASFLAGRLEAANVPTDILQALLTCVAPQVFESNMSSTRFLLREPLRELRKNIFEAEEQAAEAQAKADQASMGVSISTVSVVLSSAMKTSVDNKKSAHMVANALKSGESVSMTDRLAVPVLIVAAVISVAGLLMALF